MLPGNSVNKSEWRDAVACILVSCFRSLRASCQGTGTILRAAGVGSLYRLRNPLDGWISNASSVRVTPAFIGVLPSTDRT